MVKIAVIGICGNSVFLPVEHFHQPGETLTASACFEEVGGKGINQAVAAARMGAQVSFLAAVGDDESGKSCIAQIEKTGVHGRYARRKGEKTTFAFILTDGHGENRVTVYRGAELTEADVVAFESAIAESDVLLLQNEVPEAVNEAAAALAKKYGVKVILNPAPSRPLSEKLAGLVDVVTPNEREFEAIKDRQFPVCITTLGGAGCRIDGEKTLPALTVEAVDTTGAGDTFNGVLAVCLAEGMNTEEACRWAVAAAGLSVTKRGVLDAIPRRAEIERMLGHGQ